MKGKSASKNNEYIHTRFCIEVIEEEEEEVYFKIHM
jgi:hypothetical protein